MVELAHGNLLRADTDALVNTVNCDGFMGKGIALQFKQAFPENFSAYRRACSAGEVAPGRVFVVETGRLSGPRFIINFPTKRNWRSHSRIEDISSGLVALVEEVRRRDIHSIAIPPLGCGLGGLRWSAVRPRIEEAFAALPEVRVYLYPPEGTPEAKTMPVQTSRPGMTPARALLLLLMQRYADLGYRLTLLEVQKLAYFLQEAGEPLKLEYQAGRFGPYSANLNKVLERLEGHFIRGYGDSQKPDADVELQPGAAEEAGLFLAEHADSLQRLQRVERLIEGFETPYGMEMLATIHWLAAKKSPPVRSAEAAVEAVHAWSERKRQMFRDGHIRTAWERLIAEGWIPIV
jgi:O-acetyl-ADP-ribose deacetylase (regulator of RNase III)